MVCPFIDNNLKGCAQVLCVSNIDQAMTLCADNFVECDVFNRNYVRLNFSFRDILRRTTTSLVKKAR